jgi:xanthine dehydrogenase YagR molybdenum-binding subunit
MTGKATGVALPRRDGPAKLRGTAPFAYEHPVDDPVYAHLVQATTARGTVTGVDVSGAQAIDGVLAVLTHENAPRLADTGNAELAVLQDPKVWFRGQVIGVVVATTPETARQAAAAIQVTYDTQPHETRLDADAAGLFTPEKVNPALPAETDQGDVTAALAAAEVTVDAVYTTPMEHNNPMEPHATIACWDGNLLTLYDSTQGVHPLRKAVAPLLGLAEDQVRVIAPYVGGGFGSKGQPHAPTVVAAMCARHLPGRAVKLAVTRQQMFALVGYRTPTIQRVRLAADDTGVLTGIAVEVVEQTARLKEFAEQTATPSRSMYAAPNRRTGHRLAALDVPVASWMRAPGECPGMFGPEVAMDELAARGGVDPVAVRIRNEPAVDPDSGKPFSSRNLVGCLEEGARRFGWAARPQAPRSRLEDGWWVGTGVASSTYPVHLMPGSVAEIRFTGDDRYEVAIGAADLGTGTWTVLAQVAADALDVPVERVALRIGDTDLPNATVAGGSSGLASWGSAIVVAADAFRTKYGTDPVEGDEASGQTPDPPTRFATRAFGAQFAEVAVHADTGEVEVRRLTGVFAAGRIVNPRTARSQFLGGMTMGLSMALHEHAVMDHRYGHVVNHDLAGYHIATNADVRALEAYWLDEVDEHVNPLGVKGIGEIGIVGTAAAIANAAWHATGVRVRDLPLTPDRFL